MSTDLACRESIREKPADIRCYVSPSRLSLWARCPLAFRFRYLDGIRSPTSPSLFIGTRVHAGLERYYRHQQIGVTLPVDSVSDWMDRTWPTATAEAEMEFSSPEEEQKVKQQTVDLVRAYLAQVPEDEPRPLAVETAMEVPLVDPLSGEDLGIPLLGIVDLILDEADGASVIDFKTAARGGALAEIQHEIQLTSYSYAYRMSTGRHEGGLQIRRLVKTKVPRVEKHFFPARSAEHFGRLFSLIRCYLDDLDAGKFVYRPGWACSMCDFRDTHCRDWCG
jgi:RecB family exonuclease